MATMKITKADLIGDIKNFPIEVVNKMVEEQVRQGNRADVSVFQKSRIADRKNRGFNWDESTDGPLFWHGVISNDEFDLFFEKYPKVADSKVYIIGDSEVGMDIIPTLEARGGINKNGYRGNNNNAIYYIDPVTNIIQLAEIGSTTYNVVTTIFTCIEAEIQKVVVSLKKIAEMLNVDVNRIVIE